MSTRPATSSEYPEKVRLAFARKGLTIARIASRLGKSKSTISLVLRGKLKAARTAEQLAKVLGLSVADLGISAKLPSRAKTRHHHHRTAFPEKGSPQAILSALQSPARCTPRDVAALESQITKGRLRTSEGWKLSEENDDAEE